MLKEFLRDALNCRICSLKIKSFGDALTIGRWIVLMTFSSIVDEIFSKRDNLLLMVRDLIDCKIALNLLKNWSLIHRGLFVLEIINFQDKSCDRSIHR